MTASDYRKVLKQIGHKPTKLAKWKKHNVPKQRAFGATVKRCEWTGSRRGVIHKYGLKIARQKFREIAKKLGFKKYS